MTELIVSLLVLLGAALILVASVGMIRLPDLYTRMHASTKPATLGVSLAVGALAVHSGELGIAVRGLLIVLFFLLTAPVSAHRLAQAAYRSRIAPRSGSGHDDLHQPGTTEREPDAPSGTRPRQD